MPAGQKDWPIMRTKEGWINSPPPSPSPARSLHQSFPCVSRPELKMVFRRQYFSSYQRRAGSQYHHPHQYHPRLPNICICKHHLIMHDRAVWHLSNPLSSQNMSSPSHSPIFPPPLSCPIFPSSPPPHMLSIDCWAACCPVILELSEWLKDLLSKFLKPWLLERNFPGNGAHFALSKGGIYRSLQSSHTMVTYSLQPLVLSVCMWLCEGVHSCSC